MRKAFTILFCLLLLSVISASEELPIPSYSSVVIISIEHSIGDKAEVDYIKKNLDFGLYAWLCFSRTHVDPVLDWHTSWEEADSGIQSFKDTINSDLQKAEDQNIRLHFVLCSGLARGLYIYKEAKEEDIRNCQWYNDNKLASDEQISDSGVMDKYVFGTFSRYARKLRRNIEAKSKAALSFLSSKMSQNPDILTALSAWGEAELNYNRINPAKTIQDDFCDYSPFAVLEFRDWICHAGMYDDASGKYAGEGYSDGGSKYQGAAGLKLFNQEFGTSFATWELKYYNWSLDDTYDTDPTDNQNNDPNRIPFSDYRYGGMMPTSGARSIAGGFDPPRIIKRGDKFWDLWNLFRETMVLNFVKDVAKWADEAGIPSQRSGIRIRSLLIIFSDQVRKQGIKGGVITPAPHLCGLPMSDLMVRWALPCTTSNSQRMSIPMSLSEQRSMVWLLFQRWLKTGLSWSMMPKPIRQDLTSVRVRRRQSSSSICGSMTTDLI
jgi:hypothetical protein